MPTVSAPARIKLQNILFATGFSPAARVLLPHALELSRHYDAALYTVHVLPHMPFVEGPSPDPEKIMASAHQQFAKLMSFLSWRDVTHKATRALKFSDHSYSVFDARVPGFFLCGCRLAQAARTVLPVPD